MITYLLKIRISLSRFLHTAKWLAVSKYIKHKTLHGKGVGFLLVVMFLLLLPTHQAHAEILTILAILAITTVITLGVEALFAYVSNELVNALVALSHMIFSGAGYFMTSMGVALDTSIFFTLNSKMFKDVGAIQVGWTAVRDFSNLFFIFVLLYIAILTVVGMAGSNAKRWVAHLVIAALLINFSLFATQVVVDAGNVLGIGFWDKMTFTSKIAPPTPTAALWFMEGFRIQTTFDIAANPADPKAKPIDPDPAHMILIYLGSSLVYLVAGYVFLAGAIMMIVRSVTLMILMIFSPFAFLGFALPKGGSFASQWLSKLIGSTFVAPAFIFMLYIDSLIIRGTSLAAGSEWMKESGAEKSKFAFAMVGSVANFPIIYNFILMIILLLAALKVADAVSSGAGSSAGKWAKGAIGGGAASVAATGGLLYRQTRGRYATNMLNDKQLQATAKLDTKAGINARAKLANYEKVSKRTGDLRNAPVIGAALGWATGKAGINLGKGTTTTAYQRKEGVEKSEDEEIAKAKRLFPDNPEAQQKYLQERLGKRKFLGRDSDLQTKLGDDRHKKLGTELDRQVTTENEKKSIDENAAKIKSIDMSTAEGKVIGEAAAKAIEKSMEQLSGKEAEGLIKKHADNPAVMGALGRQHLTHMNANPADFPPDVLAKANDAVMAKGGAGAQFLINQQKMKTGVFQTDLAKELRNRQTSYKEKMETINDMEEGQAKNQAKADLREEHDSKVQDILGGMSHKEVAKLDNDLKSDETIARNYTEKHFSEIENYHKNIKGDHNDSKTKEMFVNMRNNAQKNGTEATQKYMNSAQGKKGSVFYNQAVAEKEIIQAMEKHETSKQAVTAAEAALTQALSSGLPGRISAAEGKVLSAKANEETAKKAIDKAKDDKAKRDAKNNTSGGEHDDDTETI